VLGGVAGDSREPVSTAPNPQQCAERHEEQAMLWEAVQALSPTRRAVTLLFYYRQQSVREVAAQVGISMCISLHRTADR
jgi:DNA-directed RNA polymerase specialized sigma24 family protein